MKNSNYLLTLQIIFLTCALSAQSTIDLKVDGLNASVEIITDVWGVPHIYAQNEHDLFFAQGYYAAKDRLFQFEIWRRQASGTVAEIMGAEELERDIGTRLFQFRGDMKQEMNYYHPHGQLIIEAYVDGVNAYIDYILQHIDELPLEFDLLNIEPKHWTPEIVISRHQGLLGNIDSEIRTIKALDRLGEDKVKEIAWFHPTDPNLQIDDKIDPSLFQEDVIAPYHAYRKPLSFRPDDIIGAANQWSEYEDLALEDEKAYEQFLENDINDIGSNNWVISGDRTASGFPIMANDPHRRQSAPSLRYMAHLVAPGWNVIGGGEPEIPGISIGHNEYGAWGLTVYRTDAEDLYVYELNPENSNQYLYQGRWESMRLINDTISVRDQDDVYVTHAYTRHGPVTHIDEVNHVAYAMRCGWLEVGGSPYLASLRMNQAKNWEEFRKACNYSHIPGENMIWGDRDGNIGWQAVGIHPIRNGWSGLVPVPGDGRYEWSGYLPIVSKPHVYNPSNGIINTSNENVTPEDYEFISTISHEWSDPYRGDRVREVLESGRQHTMLDMAALQTDYLSIPARQIIPMLKHLEGTSELEKQALTQLENWDYIMSPASIAAGIYNQLEKELKSKVYAIILPEEDRSLLQPQMKRVLDWLTYPDGRYGADPIAGRSALLQESLSAAIHHLTQKLGDDLSRWQYGQSNYKHITLKHPLSNAVNASTRAKIDVGPYPRGGNSLTVNNTSGLDNQISGASFRIICDTRDWDHTLAMNTPGQNGNPDHPHYRNLFEQWAKDQFFPLFYSRKKIETVVYEKLNLTPK